MPSAFCLPALAKLHDPAMDFDALGISVCSIAGTNFGPYVQLLGRGPRHSVRRPDGFRSQGGARNSGGR